MANARPKDEIHKLMSSLKNDYEFKSLEDAAKLISELMAHDLARVGVLRFIIGYREPINHDAYIERIKNLKAKCNDIKRTQLLSLCGCASVIDFLELCPDVLYGVDFSRIERELQILLKRDRTQLDRDSLREFIKACLSRSTTTFIVDASSQLNALKTGSEIKESDVIQLENSPANQLLLLKMINAKQNPVGMYAFLSDLQGMLLVPLTDSIRAFVLENLNFLFDAYVNSRHDLDKMGWYHLNIFQRIKSILRFTEEECLQVLRLLKNNLIYNYLFRFSLSPQSYKRCFQLLNEGKDFRLLEEYLNHKLSGNFIEYPISDILIVDLIFSAEDPLLYILKVFENGRHVSANISLLKSLMLLINKFDDKERNEEYIHRFFKDKPQRFFDLVELLPILKKESHISFGIFSGWENIFSMILDCYLVQRSRDSLQIMSKRLENLIKHYNELAPIISMIMRETLLRYASENAFSRFACVMRAYLNQLLDMPLACLKSINNNLAKLRNPDIREIDSVIDDAASRLTFLMGLNDPNSTLGRFRSHTLFARQAVAIILEMGGSHATDYHGKDSITEPVSESAAAGAGAGAGPRPGAGVGTVSVSAAGDANPSNADGRSAGAGPGIDSGIIPKRLNRAV